MLDMRVDDIKRVQKQGDMVSARMPKIKIVKSLRDRYFKQALFVAKTFSSKDFENGVTVLVKVFHQPHTGIASLTKFPQNPVPLISYFHLVETW